MLSIQVCMHAHVCDNQRSLLDVLVNYLTPYFSDGLPLNLRLTDSPVPVGHQDSEVLCLALQH